jgi:hypothetical protein
VSAPREVWISRNTRICYHDDHLGKADSDRYLLAAAHDAEVSALAARVKVLEDALHQIADRNTAASVIARAALGEA